LPDARDRVFKVPRKRALPPVVDLRPDLPPVMDQGNLGTCVTHGVVQAMRYSMKKLGLPDVPLSRLQLYADARRLENTSLTEDSGLEIRDAVKCAAKLGIAHEDLWPYDDGPSKFTEVPPDTLYTDALLNQALVYEAVPVNVQAVKTVLAQGVPIILGVTLYNSFGHVTPDGVVPIPNRMEGMLGGHCMLFVGYGQKPNHFLVRNSWGPDWADKGDCYMHESYITNPAYASDFWVIRIVEGFADSDAAKKLQEWADNPTAPLKEEGDA